MSDPKAATADWRVHVPPSMELGWFFEPISWQIDEYVEAEAQGKSTSTEKADVGSRIYGAQLIHFWPLCILSSQSSLSPSSRSFTVQSPSLCLVLFLTLALSNQMYITSLAMALFAASALAADVSEVWTDATSFGAMLARGDVIAKRQGYVRSMYELRV